MPPPPPPPPSPLQKKNKKKKKKKKKTKQAKKKKGIGAKCSILFNSLHPQALIDVKYSKATRTNKQQLLNCLMMEQVERKIKGVTKLCLVMECYDYGDGLLYYAERFAVVTSVGPENDYFPDAALNPPDLPIWHGGDDDNDNGDEISDEIYHAWNNAEDIVQVREEKFLVDNDNDSAPENIPGVDAVPVALKENGLPLDQDWGWDNTCNRQKDGHHHKDSRVNNHTKQDLIDLGFLEVFWLMFPRTYFYLTIVKFTSKSLRARGHQKTALGELTCFLGCIFFMACTSGFAKKEYWSSKPVSIMEGLNGG